MGDPGASGRAQYRVEGRHQAADWMPRGDGSVGFQLVHARLAVRHDDDLLPVEMPAQRALQPPRVPSDCHGSPRKSRGAGRESAPREGCRSHGRSTPASPPPPADRRGRGSTGSSASSTCGRISLLASAFPGTGDQHRPEGDPIERRQDGRWPTAALLPCWRDGTRAPRRQVSPAPSSARNSRRSATGSADRSRNGSPYSLSLARRASSSGSPHSRATCSTDMSLKPSTPTFSRSAERRTMSTTFS